MRSLHDALARYWGELPPRSAVLEEIDWLLAALAEHAGVGALLEERDRLAPLLREVDAGGQPLHGDASLSNLLSTRAGPRWNDFEDVCFGSPAWDVVGLIDDARERNGEAFAADVLAAYGRDVDQTLSELVRDADALYGALWRRYRQTITAPKRDVMPSRARLGRACRRSQRTRSESVPIRRMSTFMAALRSPDPLAPRAWTCRPLASGLSGRTR